MRTWSAESIPQMFDWIGPIPALIGIRNGIASIRSIAIRPSSQVTKLARPEELPPVTVPRFSKTGHGLASFSIAVRSGSQHDFQRLAALHHR